jgi:ribose/xylose/arabinose/galactoside ABC-type transport system permease subunit
VAHTPDNSAQRSTQAASSSLLRRVFSAQEAGLLLVIALVMAALTIFGGSKSTSIRVEIPAGTQVTQSGNVLEVGGTRHESETSWRVRDEDDGTKTAFGSRTVNKFFDKENLLQVTTKASFIAVMAVGMTAIIILAGIDLSVGSIYALAAMAGGMAVATMEPTTSALAAVGVAVGVSCAVGASAGFLNGAASVALAVHPFVITLGTMAIYRGVVFVSNSGQTVSGLPDSLQNGFFKLPIAGVYPVPTLIMLVVAVIGMVILSRTVLGRRVYAIGGNETAAKYAGIPVGKIKVIVYTLSGMLAGLSGCMYLGYFGAAESNAGAGYELQVIAAAVIGGASLSGGRGSAIGAVLGAILVQLIDNAMIIIDIDQSYNQIVMGAAIVMAVVIDQKKEQFRVNWVSTLAGILGIIRIVISLLGADDLIGWVILVIATALVALAVTRKEHRYGIWLAIAIFLFPFLVAFITLAATFLLTLIR